MKNSKLMELKPDWQHFFELAKGLVRDSIPKDEGRDTVIEMLDYGKRLDKLNDCEFTLNSGRECMLLESAINREIGYQSENGSQDTVLELCRIQERLVSEMNRGNEAAKRAGYKVARFVPGTPQVEEVPNA